MRPLSRSWALGLASLSLLVACTSGPPAPTERVCSEHDDCAEFADTSRCDARSGRCIAPCTGDVVGDYVCLDGDRTYCGDDSSLPCTVCPSVCPSGDYCAASTMSCAPLKAAGDPCSDSVECATGACTSSGQCSVEQGAACTPETCDGACLMARAGETHCVRRCGSSCESSSAGGFRWTCVRFGYETSAPSYCVPLDEICLDGSGCVDFVNGECSAACTSDGCFNFCHPDGLPPE